MPLQLDKSDRSELKTHFVRNAIPTEGNFADLIDAMINQGEDGIAKPVNDPLSIESTGDQRKAINLYGSFEDNGPTWSISLKPRLDPAKPATVPGFSVNDATGRPRLFIDANTGALGVGTAKPADALTVDGAVRMLSGSNPVRFTSAWTGFPDRVTNQAEICNDTGSYKTLMIVGNRSAGLKDNGWGRRVSVWDRLEVNGTLHVATQEPWQTPTFTGSPRWTNYGTAYSRAGFMKDSLGFVHLRGLVKGGPAGFGAGVFTLPAGYRPAAQKIFAQQTHPNVACRVDIGTNGFVYPTSANSGWLSLEGITFQAA